MKHRPGVTLVEVLVSIFIMGIGMIALLTLFPLGALNIAQAMRDARAAEAAANASAYANANDLRHDAAVALLFTNEWKAALDPNAPSSPIYVDPFYVRLNANNPLGALSGTPTTPGISRVVPTYVVPVAGNDRLESYWFSLLDDLNFENNGVPTVSGSTVQRTGRYTWAYMLRRPRLSDESTVDLSVVVYADRSLQTIAGENTFAGTGTLGTTTLTLSYTTATKPRIRNGSWILDTTLDGNTVRGYFYRVVDSSDDDANGVYTLEVQTSLKSVGANAAPTKFAIVVMENVVDVFDKGTGTSP